MGAFHQPVLAVCAPSCLETLPEAEMSCGWAKVIKYAALRADGLLPTLEGPVTEEVLADIISTCVDNLDQIRVLRQSLCLLRSGMNTWFSIH